MPRGQIEVAPLGHLCDSVVEQAGDGGAERGLVAERQGDLEGALRLYQESLTIDPNYIPAILNLASVRMNSGELGAAEELFRRAVSLAPDSYEAYNGLGIALARQGRNDESEAAFRKALEIDPNLEAARDNLRALGKTP